MKSFLQPRLVNGPFGDPALYVRLREVRAALLFDLGDLSVLSASEILRVTDAFVSHTHIDHFIGFDQLLRVVLGRDKRVRFHGPAGIIRQVRGKLAGYTWNLVEDYDLELEVAEFTGRRVRRRLFTCRDRFRREEDLGSTASDGLLLDTPLVSVRAAVLDHRTPCLGFALEERARINIHREKLAALGLAVGPWLTVLKERWLAGSREEAIAAAALDGGTRRMIVGNLVDAVATVTRGRRIGYITDVAATPENERKILPLVSGADVLYAEAAFMEKDGAKAALSCHLTAAQVGRIAGRAGVRRLEVFHLSPRYEGDEEAVRREAEEEFRKTRG